MAGWLDGQMAEWLAHPTMWSNLNDQYPQVNWHKKSEITEGCSSDSEINGHGFFGQEHRMQY